MGFILYRSNSLKSYFSFCINSKRHFQGYNYVSQTIYFKEFLQNCESIRKYISSSDIPNDFVENAYNYFLHVCLLRCCCCY